MSYRMTDEVLVRSEGRQSANAVAVPCDDHSQGSGVSQGPGAVLSWDTL